MADGSVAQLIENADPWHRVGIALTPGGGIAGAIAFHGGQNISLLRPRPGAYAGVPGPGFSVLMTFSNRISGCGFALEGEVYRVAPNLAGETYPIHFDRFQVACQITGKTLQTLDLPHRGRTSHFRYATCLRHVRRDDAITSRRQVTDLGRRLPIGGGFNPGFPRQPDTPLQFAATGVWTKTPDHLPDHHPAVSDRPDWDLREPRALPGGWTAAAFTGWHDAARIDHPGRSNALSIAASTYRDRAVIHSPDRSAGFCYVELISHAVDAHNQPGRPSPIARDQEESIEMPMTFSWSPLEVH